MNVEKFEESNRFSNNEAKLMFESVPAYKWKHNFIFNNSLYYAELGYLLLTASNTIDNLFIAQIGLQSRSLGLLNLYYSTGNLAQTRYQDVNNKFNRKPEKTELAQASIDFLKEFGLDKTHSDLVNKILELSMEERK